MTEQPASRPLPRGLLWLVVAGVFFGGLTAHRILSPLFDRSRPRPIGDGRTVESYQFDLSTTLVPREEIVPSGLARDALPALVYPRIWESTTVDSLRRASRRGKYLVPDDLVLSVTVDGHSRAYPVRVIQWHEVVNDTLGGRAIAIVHSPLSGLFVAFERRASGAASLEHEAPLTFGVSGLLHASTLLLYDDREVASLWSPLQARAIAGPAAARGDSLRVLSSMVLPWREWELLHARGQVVRPEDDFAPRYKRAPYGSYLGDDRLRFPVASLPPRERLAWKTPTLVLTANGASELFTLESLLGRADPSGRASASVGGVELVLRVNEMPMSAWVESTAGDGAGENDGDDVTARRVLWFAWAATHPGAAEPH